MQRARLTLDQLPWFVQIPFGLLLTLTWAVIWYSDYYLLTHTESWLSYASLWLLTAGTAYIFVYHQLQDILYLWAAGVWGWWVWFRSH